MSTGAQMVQYVVYDSPSDFPGTFVVRRHFVTAQGAVPESGPWALAKSLETARESVPPGLVRLGRFPDDDPVIVEVWF